VSKKPQGRKARRTMVSMEGGISLWVPAQFRRNQSVCQRAYLSVSSSLSRLIFPYGGFRRSGKARVVRKRLAEDVQGGDEVMRAKRA